MWISWPAVRWELNGPIPRTFLLPPPSLCAQMHSWFPPQWLPLQAAVDWWLRGGQIVPAAQVTTYEPLILCHTASGSTTLMSTNIRITTPITPFSLKKKPTHVGLVTTQWGLRHVMRISKILHTTTTWCDSNTSLRWKWKSDSPVKDWVKFWELRWYSCLRFRLWS